MRDFQGGGKWEKIGVNYATLRNISQWKKDKEVEANKNWAESLNPPPPPRPTPLTTSDKFRVGSCSHTLCALDSGEMSNCAPLGSVRSPWARCSVR